MRSFVPLRSVTHFPALSVPSTVAPARSVDGAGLTACAMRSAGDWAPADNAAAERAQHQLRANQFLVRDPMRLVSIGALPLVKVFGIRAVVALEPHHFAVAFEGKNVRRDAIQEPAIVRDHDGTAREVE